MLVGSDLIKLLLSHATNDELPNNVRHNCAVAIGKFALLDGRLDLFKFHMHAYLYVRSSKAKRVLPQGSFVVANKHQTCIKN